MYSASPKAKRLEFRCPDPSCNGYLAWSAMLMAMLDGIQNQITPGDPLDRDDDLPLRRHAVGDPRAAEIQANSRMKPGVAAAVSGP